MIIISLRSGAGLDGLQHVGKRWCSVSQIGLPEFSEQCIGRVYRDGQPHPVMAY